MAVPIFNANTLPLTQGQGTLPNMQGAMFNWFQAITFVQLTKTVVNSQVVETPVTTSFQGVRQPFSAQQLMMKPEGERAWRWEMIHAFPSCTLKPDDILYFNSVKYRVDQKLDYSEYGYVEYHICQDYT